MVGLGSMGKRRIRLILQMKKEIEVIGVDLNKDRRAEAQSIFFIRTTDSLEKILDSVQAVIISTSPLSHNKIIRQCLEADVDVFTELNLVSDGYAQNMALARKNHKVLFLSSTFLYRNEISFIKEKVAQQTQYLNYVYHVGQYLPSWHTWENIKDFFVSDVRTNACRELFAIELPWIIETFGKIANVTVTKNKITRLEIDYPDNYMVMVEHETGHKGLLAVDVVSKKAVRNLEIFGEDMYICWDGTPTGLQCYDEAMQVLKNVVLYDEIDHQAGYSDNIIENAYFKEIITFFEMTENRTGQSPQAIYGFEQDMETLKWIDRIEEAEE